ncbi:hypothetical protein PAE9249_00240 [Paenibacillus sp. CECT 9249]|nr:hypothetical protein PAE9249_00240 [Paenibacillus sp. CECT 9249]
MAGIDDNGFQRPMGMRIRLHRHLKVVLKRSMTPYI